jgi:hypothetical protein
MAWIYRQSQWTPVVLDTVQVLPSNSQRYAVSFDLVDVGNIWIAPSAIEPGVTNSWFTVTFGARLILLYKDWGDLVRSEWWVATQVGGTDINVVELVKQ